MAAYKNYGKTINVALRLRKDANEDEDVGSIATLFGESVFHSGQKVEEHG